MPNYLDNPAGRLLSLFEEVNKVEAGQPALPAWAQIFGVDIEDRYSFMCYAAEMVNLFETTHSLIGELTDDDPGLLLLHFGKIKEKLASFQIVASTQIGNFHLTGEALYGLQSCASLLHRRRPELVLDDEQIKELIEAVRGLLDDVIASDELDQETKRYIHIRLKDVENALMDIRITGTPRLADATDGLIGSIMRLMGRLANTHVGAACAKLAGKLLFLTASGNDVIDMTQHFKEITGGK